MTRADQVFPWLMLGSLAAHAVVGGLLALAPGGSSHRSRVQVYAVQIIEAPARPEARGLDLEAPFDRPPPATSVSPLTAPVAKIAPPPLTNSQTKTALPVPKPPPLDGDTQVSLKALPPAQSPAATSRPARNAPTSAPSTRTADSQEPPANAPARPMDRLKKKVDQLKFQVEPAPRQEAGSDEQDNVLALRLFHNAVRERVQKNYSFPGTFSTDLKARVRVVVDRDGVQRSLDLVQSSGNPRFDSLVCLSAIRNSKLPPVPDTVKGDTVTLILTCSP